MAEDFDPATLARSLEGLRLARVSNEIAGVREHPDDSPLLEAVARGQISGEEFLDRLIENIRNRSASASQDARPDNGVPARPAGAAEGASDADWPGIWVLNQPQCCPKPRWNRTFAIDLRESDTETHTETDLA